MKLTKQTDFALRALMYVAQKGSERRIFAQEIAEHYAIPINHLTKIIHKLSLLEYLNTYRGRNGGIELARTAEKICIRQVIEDFEPNLKPADCENCIITENCILKEHLQLARNAFLSSLGEKTLAEIIDPEK